MPPFTALAPASGGTLFFRGSGPGKCLLGSFSRMAQKLRPLTLFLAFVLLLTSMPRAAWAQTAPSDASLPAGTPDEDKRHGDEAMVALRYTEALTYYRRAYDATKSPALLYNMGRAYEGLAEFPKALDALEEFTEKAPPELKARVPKLDELVADVRKRVATMIVSAPVAGAEIRLGNKVLGSTKPGQTVFRVNAGPQTLTVSHRDYFPFERPLALEARQDRDGRRRARLALGRGAAPRHVSRHRSRGRRRRQVDRQRARGDPDEARASTASRSAATATTPPRRAWSSSRASGRTSTSRWPSTTPSRRSGGSGRGSASFSSPEASPRTSR